MFVQTISSVAYFEILLPLGLILFSAKFFAIIGKKIGLPQVVGMLLAGIALGFIKYIPTQAKTTTVNIATVINTVFFMPSPPTV